MQEQILLGDNSKDLLYNNKPIILDMKNHELYDFSIQFKKDNELDSIKEVVKFTSNMANKFNVPIDKMYFGGSEKEILLRGTDWCFDLARLSLVILESIVIPSRFVFVANREKAYFGHTLLECFYEKNYGLVDQTYWYVFYDKTPISAKDISNSKLLKELDIDYQNYFESIAIAEYNPIDKNNKYIISKCNEYTYKLNSMKQDGTWLLNVEK